MPTIAENRRTRQGEDKPGGDCSVDIRVKLNLTSYMADRDQLAEIEWLRVDRGDPLKLRQTSRKVWLWRLVDITGVQYDLTIEVPSTASRSISFVKKYHRQGL